MHGWCLYACFCHTVYQIPKFNSSVFTTGEATIPVADCNQVQFQSHPKHSMLFKDFIEYWEEKNSGTLEGAYINNDFAF